MFSARVRGPLTPNRLARLLEAERRWGSEILDLTESNPTRAELPYPDGLLACLGDPAARVYEPSASGLPAARAAVAADYARRGYRVAPDSIFLTAGTSEAYAFLLKLLASPGDHVLAPAPSYPLLEHLAALELVAIDSYHLRYDGRWSLDIDSVRRALGTRTRAIIVVNPNNPTGSFLKWNELEALCALCAEREVAIISDEVFADYAFGDDPARAASVAGVATAFAASLGGLSKTCGLPQLKLAWMALSGPPALVAEARERLELICDTFLSVNFPVQQAAAVLLREGAAVRDAIRGRVTGNLATLRAAVAATPAARVLDCEGGWYAVLQVPAVLSEEEWTLVLLGEDHVLVHPGYFFDFAHEAFLIVSLLPRPDIFREGISRLVARIGRY